MCDIVVIVCECLYCVNVCLSGYFYIIRHTLSVLTHNNLMCDRFGEGSSHGDSGGSWDSRYDRNDYGRERYNRNDYGRERYNDDYGNRDRYGRDRGGRGGYHRDGRSGQWGRGYRQRYDDRAQRSLEIPNWEKEELIKFEKKFYTASPTTQGRTEVSSS